MIKKIISTFIIVAMALPMGLAFAVAGFGAGLVAMGQALRDVWRQ